MRAYFYFINTKYKILQQQQQQQQQKRTQFSLLDLIPKPSKTKVTLILGINVTVTPHVGPNLNPNTQTSCPHSLLSITLNQTALTPYLKGRSSSFALSLRALCSSLANPPLTLTDPLKLYC